MNFRFLKIMQKHAALRIFHDRGFKEITAEFLLKMAMRI